MDPPPQPASLYPTHYTLPYALGRGEPRLSKLNTFDLGKSSKKKNYEILDIVRNSDAPPPRLVWTQKVGRLGLG